MLNFDSPATLPEKIRTPRLVLRRQRAEDAAAIKEAVDASLELLKASVAWAQSAPTPVEALAAQLVDASADFDAGVTWSYNICDANEQRVLGAVAIERAESALVLIVGANAFETGYWLRADSLGQGFATEATAALVNAALNDLRADRVAICHDPVNASSGGVPRRLGFRCLGIVSSAALPGRQAADGSERAESVVWVLEAQA